jgi:hypothetical protein
MDQLCADLSVRAWFITRINHRHDRQFFIGRVTCNDRVRTAVVLVKLPDIHSIKCMPLNVCERG